MRSISAPDIVIAPAEGSKHGRMQRQARLSANRLHVKKVALARVKSPEALSSGVQRYRLRCLHSAYLCNENLTGNSANPLILMVPLPRLERGTPRSTIWCSNQLSYSGMMEAAVNSVFAQTSSAQMQLSGAKALRPSGEAQEPQTGSCTSGEMPRIGRRDWPFARTGRQGAKAPGPAGRRFPSAGARTGSECRALP